MIMNNIGILYIFCINKPDLVFGFDDARPYQVIDYFFRYITVFQRFHPGIGYLRLYRTPPFRSHALCEICRKADAEWCEFILGEIYPMVRANIFAPHSQVYAKYGI